MPSVARLEGAAFYALLCMIVGAIVITVARLHQTVWRYTDLNGGLRVIAAASVILVFAVSASFVFTRLEGIPRSVPAIQWFLLVAAMVGTRIAFASGTNGKVENDIGKPASRRSRRTCAYRGCE